MEVKVLLVLLLLLSFGCGGERSTVQTPVQLTYGGGSQSTNHAGNIRSCSTRWSRRESARWGGGWSSWDGAETGCSPV